MLWCVNNSWCGCSAAASALADALQNVYTRDKRARSSETVKAGVLEALGLLVEAAPQVPVQAALTIAGMQCQI